MERVKGLEPSTCALGTRRSSQLSYTRLAAFPNLNESSAFVNRL